MNLTSQTNSIIRDWKNGYIDSANALVPELNIPKELSAKSYAEIMSSVAVKFKKLYMKDGNNIARYLTSMIIISNLCRTIGGFNKNPEVYKLYKSLFGNITNLAEQFIYQGIGINPDVPKEEAYIIAPAIPPVGITAPVGIRPIENVPEFLEVFFVSNDKTAHQIEDVMYYRNDRGFTFKAVPELPASMLDYAKKNNIKLR
jgi:hypothetical protein